MIKLERVRTAEVIPMSLRGTARVAKELQLLKQARANKFAFQSTIWKAAKKQLKLESGGKCGYCESPTDSVAHGDVEHFRPKTVYWWLAYCYDNYVFSCQLCNQKKSNEFPVGRARLKMPRVSAGATDHALGRLAGRLAPDPLTDGQGYPRARFLASCRAERPGLVDPYVNDPEPLFAWEADATLGEVRITVRGRSEAARRAFLAAEKLHNLNRQELLRERFRKFDILQTFKAALDDPGLTALRAKIVAQLRKAMASDAPYAGMSRYFIKTKWKIQVG